MNEFHVYNLPFRSVGDAISDDARKRGTPYPTCGRCASQSIVVTVIVGGAETTRILRACARHKHGLNAIRRVYEEIKR